MISVTIPEAKSRLIELIDQVNSGEEVVILRRGMPIARLVPGTPKSRLTQHSLATASVDADDADAFKESSESAATVFDELDRLDRQQPK
jgi:prevent-host-death family protein